MGIVRMGPPLELIKTLTSRFDVHNFIETGTYHGSTAVWAASIFQRVETIEFSKDLYEQTKARYSDIKNINFIFGDTRTELKKIVQKTQSPSLFWLDAHWSGGQTYGEQDQCPILDELDIINTAKFDNFILIDDARLFLSPPQPPHKIEQWPNIVDIISVLQALEYKRYIVIIEDVIIAVPETAKPIVASYCQTTNHALWIEYGQSNMRKGLKLIYSDIVKHLRKIKRLQSGYE